MARDDDTTKGADPWPRADNTCGPRDVVRLQQPATLALRLTSPEPHVVRKGTVTSYQRAAIPVLPDRTSFDGNAVYVSCIAEMFSR